MTLRLHRAAVTLPQHLLPFDSKPATKLAKSPSPLSQQGMRKQDVLRREQQKKTAKQSAFTHCLAVFLSIFVHRKRAEATKNKGTPYVVVRAVYHRSAAMRWRIRENPQSATGSKSMANVHTRQHGSDACSIQPRSGSPGACSVPPRHRTRAASRRSTQMRAASRRAPLHRTRAASRRAQNAARLSEAPHPTALPASSEPRQTKRRPREALLL